MTNVIPAAALTQHIAFLGKTGSGKTSTCKLAIEQVVAEGSRVCVLDPIKSDWWGLTSSADGKRPGLPFHILGGPHGHVPLHSGAGKAIAEIVANGQLPLSIIDMADFDPGGQTRFFVDFAPALLKRMRGVLYLVIEEAHLFAPKERSGMDKENLSVHWAKTLATAGRSKGIRLLVATQRTQALHNALLGSCDTVVAHRLTAPADQKPVLDWLKANADAAVMERVRESLSSLKAGQGWLCSGEARVFEQRQFPRIKTYDNTATPTGDGEEISVRTAPVDQDHLRAIIGDAVKEAEANDPAVLKGEISRLNAQVKRLTQEAGKPRELAVDVKALDDARRRGWDECVREHAKNIQSAQADTAAKIQEVSRQLDSLAQDVRTNVPLPPLQSFISADDLPESVRRAPSRTITIHPQNVKRQPAAARALDDMAHAAVKKFVAEGLKPVEQRILNALAELEQIGAQQPDRELLAFMAEYTNVRSKGFANAIGSLSSAGLIRYPSSSKVALTDEGRSVARPPSRPRTAHEVQQRIIGLLEGATARVLSPLIERYPNAMDRDKLGEAAGYSNVRSKGFANALGRLRGLGFIDYPERGTVVAKPVLFLEGGE